jgi:subtilisin family serine protease
VIAVAAIDQDGKLYRFASEGKIDFIAPGVDISVRDADGNQLEISGSSIATANFSGVLSLYLQKGLSLTDVFQNQHYKWIHTGEKEHKMLYFAE